MTLSRIGETENLAKLLESSLVLVKVKFLVNIPDEDCLSVHFSLLLRSLLLHLFLDLTLLRITLCFLRWLPFPLSAGVPLGLVPLYNVLYTDRSIRGFLVKTELFLELPGKLF